MKKQHRSSPFKLLSLLLALAMLFCMIPFSAAALENDTSAETAQGISAFSSQGESSAEEIFNESAPSTELGLGELSTEVLATMEVNAEDIPEVIPMARAQEKGLVNRLYAQEESLSTVLFQTKSGSKTAYVFGKPVKYVDASGAVRDKSTAITGVLDTTYAYGMLDNNVKVYFPRNITSGVLLSYNDYSITMSPEVSGSYTAFYAQEENAVTYADVFGERTILSYTPTLYGVKEDIILVSYTGKNSFDFIMEQQGLTAMQNDGVWQLVNAADQVVAGLGSVIVKDSAGKTAMGELTLTPLAGGKYRVTVIAPEDFLTAEDTVYPVYVDPTVSVEEVEIREVFDEYGDLFDDQIDTIIDVGLYQAYDDYNYAVNHPDRHMIGLGDDYCRVIYKFYDFYGEGGWFTHLRANQIGSVTLHVNAYNVDPITATVYPMTATWSPYEGENPIALWDADEVNLWDEINTTYGTTTIEITSDGSYAIDITQIAKGWAKYNHGVSDEDYHNPENGFCIDSNDSEYICLQSVEASASDNVYYEIDYDVFVGADFDNDYHIFFRNTTSSSMYYLCQFDDGEDDYLQFGSFGDSATVRGYPQWTFEYLGYNSEGEPEYYVYLKDRRDVAFYYNGVMFDLANCNNSAHPEFFRWTVDYVAGGYYLRHSLTDQYLDINGQYPTMLSSAPVSKSWYFAEIKTLLDIETEQIEGGNKAWVAAARVFARYYYPQTTMSQNLVAQKVLGSGHSGEEGTPEDAANAIVILVARYASSFDLSCHEHQVFTESTMVRLLNEGHVIWCGQGLYEFDELTDEYTRNEGTACLIYGYVTFDDEILFLAWEPDASFDDETIRLISYTNLYTGNGVEAWEPSVDYVLESVISVETSYSNNTVPFYYD